MSHGTTRTIDTIDGPKLYSELVPVLAFGVEAVMADLAQSPSHTIIFSQGAIQSWHREAFQSVVGWAGALRTKDVEVRAHRPPPFYLVPQELKKFADNLEAQVQAVSVHDPELDKLVELFAYAEGRFTHVHPFLDFNGRTSRMISWALVLRLQLPAPELVPPEGDESGRQTVLDALAAFDDGDPRPLKAVWQRRLEGAFGPSPDEGGAADA